MKASDVREWLLDNGWRPIRHDTLSDDQRLEWWITDGAPQIILHTIDKIGSWQVYREIDTSNQIEPTLEAIQKLVADTI